MSLCSGKGIVHAAGTGAAAVDVEGENFVLAAASPVRIPPRERERPAASDKIGPSQAAADLLRQCPPVRPGGGAGSEENAS